MPKMGKYCKAYPVERFREYSAWAEKPAAKPNGSATAAAGDEAKYLFLQDSYIVTKDVYADEMIVFDSVTEDWIAFCHEKLRFEIPEFIKAGAA